ncbi:MAG TPA: TIM barrel protein [Planctomycetota bacterium]|nr:TIM barrel protein [Planctomycetota bacterium]
MSQQTNRRDFLKSTALAAAAFGTTALSSSRANGGELTGKIKKALHLGMIGEKLPLIDKLKLVKDLGFHGIELNSPTGVDKDELKKGLEATGLGISEVIDGLHWKEHLSSPNDEVRARGVAALRTSLEDAKFFGTDEVLLVPGVVNANVKFEDCWTRSQAEIKKVIPYAKELGVKIGIENVWNNFINDPETMVKYIDEFQSEWIVAHYDVGNHVKYNKPEHWIRTLGKRIYRLHIKEFSNAKQFDVKLGDGGDIVWPEVVKALKEIGYSGWATAEVRGGDRAAIKDISERMDKILSL